MGEYKRRGLEAGVNNIGSKTLIKRLCKCFFGVGNAFNMFVRPCVSIDELCLTMIKSKYFKEFRELYSLSSQLVLMSSTPYSSTVALSLFYHAGCAPDVCWCTVAGSRQHLKRTILPGLDVICEMFLLQEEEKNPKS